MKTKNTFAFSLVELMISLITISCIAAAFTPVITKKLKKQDVALSIAQTSEITNNCKDKFGEFCELCTKAYCINCSLNNCSDGEYVDSKDCVCKSCTDISKGGIENCVSCVLENSKIKCTKCRTDAPGYIIKNDKCEKCPNSSLPSDGISQCGVECATKTGYYCKGQELKSCTGTYGMTCNTCNDSKCVTCAMSYYINPSAASTTTPCLSCGSNGGACRYCSTNKFCTDCYEAYVLDEANGKCVADLIDNCSIYVPKTGSVKKLPSNYKCSTCKGGYYPANNGASCELCTSMANCLLCNATECTKCETGYYGSGLSCKQCSITNCANCTPDGKCGSCNKGYHLSDNLLSCEADNGVFECSDSNFMQVVINGKKLCITRKNMGDTKVLTIPSTVTVVEADEYCYTSSDNSKCCWSGATSTACDDENGGYSGCNRTVCEWNAGKEICDKYTYGGLKWRMPTYAELAYFAKFSQNLGANGLQLCDPVSSGYYSAYCRDQGHCLGAYSNHCYASRIYSSEETSATGARRYYMSGGNWNNGADVKTFGFSVRCVTEME